MLALEAELHMQITRATYFIVISITYGRKTHTKSYARISDKTKFMLSIHLFTETSKGPCLVFEEIYVNFYRCDV